MNSWAKTTVSITLLCYLAVSSIAAVHAFSPSVSAAQAAQTSQGIVGIADQEMSPSCHQQQSHGEPAVTSNNCKIFCAAMSNVINGDIAAYIAPLNVATEITFLLKDVAKLTLAREPHPPKTFLAI